ncbi:MAG: matrixin family metalloprotease [Gemmatimonadota bacterium]
MLPTLTVLVLVLILADRFHRPAAVPAVAVTAEPAIPVAKSGLPARSAPGFLTSTLDPGTPTIDRLARLATRRTLNAEGRDTYLDSLLLSTDSVLRRWPSSMGRPVRVAIVEREIPSYAPRMAAYVRESLRNWEQTGIDLSFLPVADTLDADIVVRWIHQFPIDRTGQTDLTWDQYGRVQKAIITLAVADGHGTTLPGSALLSVAMHEVGHAIGLPHSGSAADVMYPEPRITGMSDRDRRTALLLYDLPSGSIKDSVAQ